MPHSRVLGFGLVAICGAALFAPCQAGLDVDLSASVSVTDANALYLAITSRCFGQERRAVEAVAPRFPDPDDLAVALFISQHAGREPREVLELRRRGLDWWEISRKFHLPVEIWFLEMSGEPAPPFRRAYGGWRGERHDRRSGLKLTNDELRHLVAVHVLHDYFDIPVEKAMRLRADGDNLRWIVAREYGLRHGR